MAYSNTNKLMSVQLEESKDRIIRAETIHAASTPEEKKRLLRGPIPYQPAGPSQAEYPNMPDLEVWLKDTLSVLETTQHVLIQRAGVQFVDNFFDLRNRFDLLNTEGDRIFFAGETLQVEGNKKMMGPRPTFDVTILGCHGGGILDVMAKKGLTTVSNFHETLGYIVYRRGGFCCSKVKAVYSVQDMNGRELFLLKRFPVRSDRDGSPGEYEIIDTSTNSLVGRLSRNWVGEIPASALWFNAYGVSFLGQDMDVTTKILLMGALCTVVGTNGFTGLGAFMQKDF